MIKTAAILIGFLLVMGIVGRLDYDLAKKHQAPTVRCEEDMPCWDCTTMGNRICGPIAP